ncbi:MAG: hypothetical protein ABIO91_04015 [Pyrinomonadaceae bacterium]
MLETEIKFERENREGVVAIGTYLMDAAKRFGIHFEDVCVPVADVHYCSVTVKSGTDLLSEMTGVESEHFSKKNRKTNERLACQARIEKPGEIKIMTKKKVDDTSADATAASSDTSEEYKKAFTEMPLEKKIANLVQLETIAFGETVSFIINSPFKIADKVMDVMAEFGMKKEEKQKEAARPAEHQGKASNGNPDVKPKREPKDSI